ncbi:hypothetical protein [Rummeliibacillus pycnus]|uniref:hypothetical protein n=1 Tax=Rummeliibacillus pycnus TaxID=101070 RepID=UPI0037CBFF51
MTALTTIVTISSKIIMEHLDTIFLTMKTGSVITVDQGILTLAKLSSVSNENNDRIFPFLLHHLETCRPKELPQHAESTLIAANNDNKEAFLTALKRRENELTAPQLKRIKKIYKVIGLNE